MATEALGWWGVPLGILAGTLRGSAPFLFVSLGECLTEKKRQNQPGSRRHLTDGSHECLRRFLPLPRLFRGILGTVARGIGRWHCGYVF